MTTYAYELKFLRVTLCVLSLASIVSKMLNILSHPAANHNADIIQLAASVIVFVYFFLGGSFRLGLTMSAVVMAAGGLAGLLRATEPSWFFVLLLIVGVATFFASLLYEYLNAGR